MVSVNVGLLHSQEVVHVDTGVLNAKKAETLKTEANSRSNALSKSISLVFNVTSEEYTQEGFKRVKTDLRNERKRCQHRRS